jgi:hypothetical protein
MVDRADRAAADLVQQELELADLATPADTHPLKDMLAVPVVAFHNMAEVAVVQVEWALSPVLAEMEDLVRPGSTELLEQVVVAVLD